MSDNDALHSTGCASYVVVNQRQYLLYQYLIRNCCWAQKMAMYTYWIYTPLKSQIRLYHRMSSCKS